MFALMNGGDELQVEFQMLDIVKEMPKENVLNVNKDL